MTKNEHPLETARRLQAKGSLDEAIAAYRRAAKAEPENAELYYGWACANYDLGYLKKAERLLAKVLALAPGHAPANSKVGAIYARQGWPGWGIWYSREALKHDPAYLPAYGNLAMALIERGDLWESETISRDGLKKDGNSQALHSALGMALHLQGRAPEAIEEFERAIELSDELRAENLCILGMLHLNLGDTKKALQHVRRALKADPGHVESHYLFAGAHKYKKGDPHIKQMQRLLKKVAKTSREAQRLHFALGKAYDDAGDVDAAFRHFAQGNWIVRSGYNYTTETTRKTFAALKKTYAKDFTARELAPRKNDITPVFIVGMPRSGTTLVEQILCSHPQMAAGGEAQYLEQLYTQHGAAKSKNIMDFPGESLRAMRDEYLAKLARHAPGATIITDKMPTNFRFIGMIRILFPQAKIIHCRREPMDSCFSIYKHMFNGFFPFAYDLAELGQYYKHYEDLMAFWHEKLPGFIHDVQYEELVAEQERVTRDMLAFCGLKWDPACLQFHKKERAVMTASSLQVKKPLYKKGVGSWRKYEKHLGLLKKALD